MILKLPHNVSTGVGENLTHNLSIGVGENLTHNVKTAPTMLVLELGKI
jgi:hypothetical protein